MSACCWTMVFALPALVDAISLSVSQQRGRREIPAWPSPGHEDCAGSANTGRLFQETKAALREDPLNFDVINGTSWSGVDRAERLNYVPTTESDVYRADIGPDCGLGRFAMLCEDYAAREGFYDLAFEVLDNVDRFPPEQAKWAEMKVWVSLSDHALIGAPGVANRGYPNGGVDIAVQRLKANPEPRKILWLGQMTLRYEIQMNLQGLLWTDVDHTRGVAAMAAGAAEELVHTLRTEHDLCSPLFTACSCMNLLILQNYSYAAKFRELGAPELAANAAKQCATPITDAFMFGRTFGEGHPAGETCAVSAAFFR